MKNRLRKIKEKRFKEINDRLNKLTSGDIRKYLYTEGYYPENHFLPNDYFSTKSLKDRDAVRELKDVDPKQSSLGEPSFLFFPKSKYTFRALGIPSLENYINLSNFIADNWKKIKLHLLLDNDDLIVPYSYPLFYTDKKRGDIGIRNYKVFSEIDMPIAISQYNFCVFVDIKNFYPSIYTHSLAWALDPLTVHRANCGCAGRDKCKSHKYDYWPNKLDELTRKINRNRTKGIFVGPYTSDLESEILLRAVDKKLSAIIAENSKDFVGYRFKDDYVFFADKLEDADFIRKQVQHVLHDYHLEVNEQKTRIITTDEIEDKKTWKVEMDALKQSVEDAYKKVDSNGNLILEERQINFWLKKIKDLHSNYKDEYIIKTAFGKLIDDRVKSLSVKKSTSVSLPHKIELEDVLLSILSNLINLCKKAPSSWPLFIAIVCLCYEGTTNNKQKKNIEVMLNSHVDLYVKSNDTFFLIWTLYGLWRCDLEISKKNMDEIKKSFKDNSLIMSIIFPNEAKIVINKKTYTLINSDRDNMETLSKVISVFSYSANK